MPRPSHVAEPNTRSKVGIFMPCYNMGDFIDEALDSLYKQTFTDFTVIIADDASTLKATRDKLATINQPRSQVYYEHKNLGLVKISNKYMSMIDAEYIMLFSPDDKMHKDFLKEQVAYLDAHPDVHAVCTWIQEFGDGSQLIKYDDDSCKLPNMLVENHYSGAALMRKTAWLAAGKHDTNPDLYPNLDYDLWLSMLEKGFVLGTIPKTLFYWRSTKKSLSHNVDADRVLTFRKALLKKYLPVYQKYSAYVMGRYLEVINEFEKYYATSEEGHAWLDRQYNSLTSENASLRLTIEDSIRLPHTRKIKNAMKKFRSLH